MNVRRLGLVTPLLFSCSVVSESFVTPCPPGSSVHGISQARTLEQAYHLFLQRAFPTRGSHLGSCTGRWGPYHRASREAQLSLEKYQNLQLFNTKGYFELMQSSLQSHMFLAWCGHKQPLQFLEHKLLVFVEGKMRRWKSHRPVLTCSYPWKSSVTLVFHWWKKFRWPCLSSNRQLVSGRTRKICLAGCARNTIFLPS